MATYEVRILVGDDGDAQVFLPPEWSRTGLDDDPDHPGGGDTRGMRVHTTRPRTPQQAAAEAMQAACGVLRTQGHDVPCLLPGHQQAWNDFRDNGLLWLVNRTLHVFGHSLVLEHATKVASGEDSVPLLPEDLVAAYPARTPWRGFANAHEGFAKLHRYMAGAAQELLAETVGQPQHECPAHSALPVPPAAGPATTGGR